MTREERLQKAINDLREAWRLLIDRMADMRKQMILETRVEEKHRLQGLLDIDQQALDKLERDLQTQEAELASLNPGQPAPRTDVDPAPPDDPSTQTTKLALPPVRSIHGASAETVSLLQEHTARALGFEVAFRDKRRDGQPGPWMLVIPAGVFRMGSPEDELERDDDEQQHDVAIRQPFAIGRCAVTFAEFDQFVLATGHRLPDSFGWGREDRPVVDVSWFDAMAYCEWLSAETGAAYRLPTEAEWEYACRAGATTAFWWGNEISTVQANYSGHRSYGNGREGKLRRKTLPVESFAINSWRLCQVHGNVWEWTASAYAKNYEGSESALSDKDHADLRVVRGGSWNNIPRNLRAATRNRYVPDKHDDLVGFRLARAISV
jgi:formylglycine-generating enzyme required for sulfatase activity